MPAYTEFSLSNLLVTMAELPTIELLGITAPFITLT